MARRMTERLQIGAVEELWIVGATYRNDVVHVRLPGEHKQAATLPACRLLEQNPLS